MTKELKSSIKQLVAIEGLNGKELDHTIKLTPTISLNEYFPGTTGYAYYVLNVISLVHSLDEISGAKSAARAVLEELALVWPFVCGYQLPLNETRETTVDEVIDNQKEVTAQMENEAGMRTVEASFTASVEVAGTYYRPPLTEAVTLRSHLMNDSSLRVLLTKYRDAELNLRSPSRNETWFLNLYTVREQLERLYGGEAKVRRILGIPRKQWSQFGKHINDLRHKTANSVPEPVSRKLANIAKGWIVEHLRLRGYS